MKELSAELLLNTGIMNVFVISKNCNKIEKKLKIPSPKILEFLQIE